MLDANNNPVLRIERPMGGPLQVVNYAQPDPYGNPYFMSWSGNWHFLGPMFIAGNPPNGAHYRVSIPIEEDLPVETDTLRRIDKCTAFLEEVPAE